MTRILAIDPGTTQSGWVNFDDGIVCSGVMQNEDVLRHVGEAQATVLAVEMIASYGMPVGAEVFETCVYIGELKREWELKGGRFLRVYRKDVKMHLCGTPRAKDPNIRQALIDLLGPPGTKREPGPTFGVKSHAWAALGVAVTADAMLAGKIAA